MSRLVDELRAFSVQVAPDERGPHQDAAITMLRAASEIERLEGELTNQSLLDEMSPFPPQRGALSCMLFFEIVNNLHLQATIGALKRDHLDRLIMWFVRTQEQSEDDIGGSEFYRRIHYALTELMENDEYRPSGPP